MLHSSNLNAGRILRFQNNHPDATLKSNHSLRRMVLSEIVAGAQGERGTEKSLIDENESEMVQRAHLEE
jgi:hypothetical protein